MKSKMNMGTIPSAGRGSVTTGDQRAESAAVNEASQAVLDTFPTPWRATPHIGSNRSTIHAANDMPVFGGMSMSHAKAMFVAHRINSQAAMLKALNAASSALRSYQYGNSATELAEEIADACDIAIRKAGASMPMEKPRDDGTAIEPGHEPGA